jgi:hypothetical protein
MKSDHIVTDLGRAEDADRILELNRLEYGEGDILATRADFVWRHDRNPAGQAIVPVIRDGRGSVVGFIWIVPLRLCIKGQDRLAATGTNLVIHPEYRDTFGYPKLLNKLEQALRENYIALHFSFVSEQTSRRQRERAPQTVTTIPLLVKALDTKSLAHSFLRKEWQRFIVGQAGQLVSPLLFRGRSRACSEGITVRAVDQFGASFDEFWARVRDKYPVMSIRDRAFLAWRFANVSGRCYNILVASAYDRMLGYAVLRCTTIRNTKVGLVMDLLVTDDALGEAAGASLMAEADIYFRTQKMPLAAGLMVPFASEYKVFRRVGFLSLPSAFMPRKFHFAFYVHNTGASDLMSLSIMDWFVTLADYESF